MGETTGLFRLYLLSTLCLFFIGCGPTPPPVPPGPPPGPQYIAQALLDAHNAYRQANRCGPFRLDSRLSLAAQEHAAYMAQVGKMAHEGIGDGSPWDRIKSAGYSYTGAAENVAMGGDLEGVMRLWEGSPAHRANMLGPYTDFGGGTARSSNGTAYWCVDFGRSR